MYTGGITYCDHCTNDFDKFCDVFRYVHHVKIQYGSSYVEELTAELVAKEFGARCECAKLSKMFWVKVVRIPAGIMIIFR